ncbi:hypothetical protein F4X10_21195 [Candidatus Poribacteria bacterium]|nr:hypothetical protein [Candidatus Poribacteria bacterium]
MQSLESPNISTPMVLTDQQRNVLEALQNKQTDEYPLSDWYLGALYALDNHYNPDRIAQAAHSLRELLEKLTQVVQESDIQIGTIDFKGMRRSINDRILKDKKRYPEGWKDKEINTHLDKTLRKVVDYFERNQQPTRGERIQQAVATIDPMANSLDSEIQERKRNQLLRLWQSFERFTHHNSNTDIVEFSNCLKELENTIFDLLAPITAQDQEEIQTILRSPDRSENDVERMFSLIERRGANSVFFFQQIAEITDVSWLPELEKRDYFKHPSSVEPIGDGQVIFPLWWPIRYLAKISSQVPDAAIEIVLQLPKIDNPRVYDGVLDIALQLHGEQSAKLKPKILEPIGMEYPSRTYRYADLLAHWTKENQISDALELSKILVAFVPDPRLKEKQKRRKENPMSWGTLLHPSARFNHWEYSEIMTKGVCPLAQMDPCEVARLLIYATSNMLSLRIHQDEFDKAQDFSNIWFARLHIPEKDYGNPDETLVHTLTFACEKVFEKSHDAITDLDKLLRKQKWKIFKRLRQHLYSQYPNESTKPWIRELILERKDYHQSEHSYEFQQMIRQACDHFKETLLTKEERTRIFDAIRSGPPKDDFREWLGEKFTEELFQKRQHYFHRQQLTPFASVLFDEYKTYFQELESKADDRISDENYPPFGVKVGAVSNRSPYLLEDLANLTDEQLLARINEWETEDEIAEHDSFVKINIEALANTFQTLFKESIIPDTNRLRFWMENGERIERPIYVRMMIYAMQAHVKEKNFNQLNEWLTFYEWVLSHPDREHNADYKLGDESRENPQWSNSRRAVGDFIGVCFEKEVDVPIVAREQLAKLLETICTQHDRRLDENHLKVMNQYDPLTEGINNTRSRALENLITFGFWLRDHDSDPNIPEVTTILEKRFSPETNYPLTLPEYAILGKNYPWICSLNETWAIEHKSDFFPQSKLPEWAAAFSSFVLGNGASKPIFKILKDDFNFALQHLRDIKNRNQGGREPITVLGERLFHYYLLDMFPLEGQESLLERFYQQTGKKHWANLFNYIGHRLWNTGKDLNQNTEDRARKFCDWRLRFEEPTELRYFTTWLQAECLSTEWRLKTYSKVLDICKVEDWGIHVKTLCEMLPNHTEMVVECFFKLTEGTKKDNIYIQKEVANAILKAGRESKDESVRSKTKLIRENLLNSGRFVLPDLED